MNETRLDEIRERFAEREKHLRQRVARDWTEDRDVAICIDEIDRITEEFGAEVERLRGALEGLVEYAMRGAAPLSVAWNDERDRCLAAVRPSLGAPGTREGEAG